MIARTILHISLGVFLTGCTITNNLNSQYPQNLAGFESQEKGSKPPLDPELGIEEDEDTEYVVVIRKKGETVGVIPSPQRPRKQPQAQAPAAPVAAKNQSKYCESYDPLAVPSLVRYDADKFAEAAKVYDDATITKLLSDNIVAINKQINNYRGHLKKHRDEWLRKCGK